MKIGRKIIMALFVALACSFVFRSYSINIENQTEISIESASIKVSTFIFGDGEHLVNLIFPTSGVNNITFSKKQSQTGISHYSLFCCVLLKYTTDSFPLLSSIITPIHFFSSSWFLVFGFRKIIV